MPAKSVAQQKFMGMVHAAQKGEEPASPEVAKVAKDMGKKAAKDFASTKHKGLPDHVDESNHKEWDDLTTALKDLGYNYNKVKSREGSSVGKVTFNFGGGKEVSFNRKNKTSKWKLSEGTVTDRPEEPTSDDLNLPSAAIPGVSAENTNEGPLGTMRDTKPTPTNDILWKATGKVCEGRSMAERIKMYEKKGGGWRMGKQRDEQVYNNLKEFYKNEIAPRKEAKALIVKRRMGESINEMTDEVGEADGADHEVSMARASLINIQKACQDLMGKIGSQEKDLPGWIQDHITNSENYIMQASKGYYEQDEKLKGNTITGPTQLDQNGK